MHVLTYSLSFFSTSGQNSRRYFSLYFGNKVAKELSSNIPCGLSSAVKDSIFQWSMPSWSHATVPKKETTKPIINQNNVTSVNDTGNLMFSLLQTNLKPWNFNTLYSTIEIHVYLNPVNTNNGTKIVINNLRLQFVTTNTYHKFWTLIIADFFGTSVYGTIS